MSDADKNRDAAKLSAAIRGGDEAAFVSYYEEMILHVTGRVEKITGDRDEAWDIAQDTFAKLWQQRENIDPEKSLDALIKTMAANTAINARKRKQTHARYHQEQMFLQNDEDHSADARIIQRETQRRIDAIVAAMPPQRRKVFMLSKEDGLTYNEIAQRMNLSPGTVHRHMSLALEELRSLMSVLACIIIATSV